MRTIVTALLCFLSLSLAAKDKEYLNIVFIGNSITKGAHLTKPSHESPPARAAVYLKQQEGIESVRYSNQGVSGHTTVDFLPETNTNFNKVCEAADQMADETWATLIFSMMLGTNDSACTGPLGAPVSPEQYTRNMQAIMLQLLTRYPNCKIILHRPLWYSPNTHNNARYLAEGLARLNSYYPCIQQLVADLGKRFPNQVYLGDTEGYSFFEEHGKTHCFAEKGRSGTFYLHPNAQGAKDLGIFWGKAISKAIQQQ